MPAPGSQRLETPGKSPLSVVALQIVREALKPDASPATLARLAESDPGFALRVISMVNSAAFGFNRKVSDVRQATAFIGVRGLRTLGLSLAVSDMVPAGPDGQMLLSNSLRRAVTCQTIAKRLGQREVDEYFTAGLFLEVGLLARAREDLKAAAEVARLPSADRVVFERASSGTDHAVRGAGLAKAFQLPAELVEAVACHHDPVMPDAQLAKVAWAAEKVAAIWEGGDVPSAQAQAAKALAVLGLGDRDIVEILDQVPALVLDGGVAFERDVGVQKSVDALLLDVSRSLIEMNQSYESMVRRLEQLVAEKEELSTKLQQANAELTRLASTDGLTGLPNKRSLEAAITRDLARADRDKTWLSLLVVDVDHFKRVNDTFGHAVGDVVLQNVARILSKHLRAGDLAGRFGGEEFVLILPGSNMIGARIAAERIRKALEAHVVETEQGTLQVTASFGAAAICGPGCAGRRAELFSQADSALYEAKRTGRNRVVVFDGSQASGVHQADAEALGMRPVTLASQAPR
jgi:diguanylate cyclase (GGDEF)-like protein